MDKIKFGNYVGHLLLRNGKKVEIFIPQRTLRTDGRHRCDKPVNVLQGSFQIVTVEKTVNGNFIGQLYFELLEEGNLLVSMSVRRK